MDGGAAEWDRICRTWCRIGLKKWYSLFAAAQVEHNFLEALAFGPPCFYLRIRWFRATSAPIKVLEDYGLSRATFEEDGHQTFCKMPVIFTQQVLNLKRIILSLRLFELVVSWVGCILDYTYLFRFALLLFFHAAFLHDPWIFFLLCILIFLSFDPNSGSRISFYGRVPLYLHIRIGPFCRLLMACALLNRRVQLFCLAWDHLRVLAVNLQ